MRNLSLGRLIATLSVVGVAGYAFFTFGGFSTNIPVDLKAAPTEATPIVEAAEADPVVMSNSVAMRYAQAVQKRDCEDVIRMTLWMRERMEHDALKGISEGDAKRALCADLQDRRREDNLLQHEGIDDKYVFSPEASLTSLGTDEGRNDLEATQTAFREWIKVIYPSRDTALRDKDGQPVRSIEVGVNVSKEGYILKAAIVGNLDINYDSIAYNWPAQAN